VCLSLEVQLIPLMRNPSVHATTGWLNGKKLLPQPRSSLGDLAEKGRYATSNYLLFSEQEKECSTPDA